ncbi:hypothetical protein FB563_5032 [Streptomyces puniciscabiei]|uniref:Immunity protein 50 of polymorphic toxin system n=1 Tax=Streptomyces puniciscabiei TaxID=164348 RepID=A0A542ULI0_9ACTN|nr:hypothetical protein [Streptomyces puniciscabiei]TQK99948.1 hypothetical protein FB563_5032 [Streptomyces puniciscabiei]
MRFVKTHWHGHGFYVDPRAYLAELPRLYGVLPPGAWEFASDPGHYDIPGAVRCVKDLELAHIRPATDKSGQLVLEFAPNRFKHDSGLRITYSGVRHFSIDHHRAIDWLRVDTVLLDEILPDDESLPAEDGAEAGGCVHEIALTDASITVRCQDLRAEWGSGS